MCKDLKAGGQRCAHDTRKALAAAARNYETVPGVDHLDALQAARAEHASTKSGRAEIEADLQRMDPNSADAIDLQYALRRGDMLKERARALGDAQRDLGTWADREEKAADPTTQPAVLERIYKASFDVDTSNFRDEMDARNAQYRAVANPNAPRAVLDHAIQYPRLAIAVGEHASATPEHLTTIATRKGDSDAIQLGHTAAAANPNTPLDVVENHLSHSENTDVRAIVARRSDISDATFDRLTRDNSITVLQACASTGRLNEEQEHRLAAYGAGEEAGEGGGAWEVHQALGAHARSPQVLETLAQNENAVSGVAQNRYASATLLHQVARRTASGDTYNPTALRYVVDNQGTASETFTELGKHPAPTVRQTVALGTRTPRALLETLRNDPDEYVREAAEKSLARLSVPA